MSDKRKHRGPAPGDRELFSNEQLEALKKATADYSLLLTMGYPAKASLKLVGDRFELTARQRMAVFRSGCSRAQAKERQSRQVEREDAHGLAVAIDGYNLLITIEAALGGAPIFVGQDGCARDLTGVHGTYRNVAETMEAAALIARGIEAIRPASVVWYIDSPVSNSGRLKGMLLKYSRDNDLGWSVEVLQSPDNALALTDALVVTSDSDVLDKCGRWINLGRMILETAEVEPWMIRLHG